MNAITLPSDSNWIQTHSGIAFPLLEPRPEHVRIEDIAHALARQCRYGGHCKTFYSVAQHSVILAQWLLDTHRNRQFALEGLLHDAAEAYVIDVPRPLKMLLPRHTEIEANIQAAIRDRLGLYGDVPEEVHDADRRILTDERDQLMAPCSVDWGAMKPALGVTLTPTWMPAQSEREFLALYHGLTCGY